MHTKAMAASALFASSLASIVTPSASTSDPTITPGPNIELLRKQNNDRYMGWVAISGVWSSQQCESGATYFQSGGHWRCCAATSAGCDIPQACVNGNLIYNGAVIGASTSLTFPCTSVYPDPTDSTFTICNTAFMYENEQDSTPQTNVNCGISSVNWSYYRVQPEAAKTSSRTSTTRPTSAETTSSDSSDGDANASRPTVLPSPSEEKSSSKAWIAGAVVGPILGLALIGFLVWFCLRRKKKNNAAAAAGPATQYAPQPAPATVPSSPPQYYPPPMAQHNPATAPFGVTDGKQAWTPSPVSPTSQPASPPPQAMYGAQYPQQGGHAGPGQPFPSPDYPQAQPVYNAPSPSLSPPPQMGAYAENSASYPQVQTQQPFEARPFSSELDASSVPAQPQPKTS